MTKTGELAAKQVKSAAHRQKTETQAIAIGLSEARAKGGKVPKVPPSRARR